MNRYRGLIDLKQMESESFFKDAIQGVLFQSIDNINNAIGKCDSFSGLDQFVKSLLAEASAKFFYLSNMIIELKRYISKIKENNRGSLDKLSNFDIKDNHKHRTDNIKLENRDLSSIFIFYNVSSDQELLNILVEDLTKVDEKISKLREAFLAVYRQIQVKILVSNWIVCEGASNYLRGGLGYFKVLPDNVVEFSALQIKDFLCDFNLYYSLSKKMIGVPSEISPVISPKYLFCFKEIIDRELTYQDAIKGFSSLLKTHPSRIMVIDRELQEELIPVPEAKSYRLKNIVSEVYYFYFLDNAKFEKYLANEGAQIDGVRPVWSIKRQEQYFHINNESFAGFDLSGFIDYVDMVKSLDAKESKLYYDDFYKTANELFLNINEVIASNFDYVYINNTNSMWRCTPKLAAKKYLLT